jgi:hypothetical protein
MNFRHHAPYQLSYVTMHDTSHSVFLNSPGQGWWEFWDGKTRNGGTCTGELLISNVHVGSVLADQCHIGKFLGSASADKCYALDEFSDPFAFRSQESRPAVCVGKVNLPCKKVRITGCARQEFVGQKSMEDATL